MLEDWSGFLSQNANLLDTSNIPEAYLQDERRFQEMLAWGHSPLDWSDWSACDAHPATLMQLIERYLAAGGRNELLCFLGEEREAILQRVPEWPVGHRGLEWYGRREKAFRDQVASTQKRWLSLREEHQEALPEGWAPMRYSAMQGTLLYGIWAIGRESRCWSDLAPAQQADARLMVSELLAAGLVLPWLPFLPWQERRKLASRYRDAF